MRRTRRRLTTEIALLRGLQEVLRNVHGQARATVVHVTLSYMDDLVVLDISDGGTGFDPDTTADRGEIGVRIAPPQSPAPTNPEFCRPDRDTQARG